MVALEPGSPFPQIELRDEKGDPAKPPPGAALLGFFKTTCPTSALAWPYLDRVRRLARAGTLAVLGVSQDDPETTERFYAELGVAVPTLYDPDPWPASAALGLTSVPTFVLVAKDGRVADASVGFQRHKMEQYAAAARRPGQPAAELFLPGESVPEFRPG